MTLNASASDDPEGNPLLYQFFDNGVALTDPVDGPAAEHDDERAPDTYKPAAGSHRFTVKVEDVGKLTVDLLAGHRPDLHHDARARKP